MCPNDVPHSLLMKYFSLEALHSFSLSLSFLNLSLRNRRFYVFFLRSLSLSLSLKLEIDDGMFMYDVLYIRDYFEMYF